MVLPAALVAPMTAARTLLDGHSAPILQLTLARFIDGGHFGAHVRTMRAVYAERRDVLARLVDRHLSHWLQARACRPAACDALRAGAGPVRAPGAGRGAAEGRDLLGLTGLHASARHKAGFLMGFAAHAPNEQEVAIRKLAGVLRAEAALKDITGDRPM